MTKNHFQLNPILLNILFFILILPSLLSLNIEAKCPQNLSLEDLNKSKFQISEKTKWFKAKEKPVGIILLIHGLNLRPSKMDSMAIHFQQSGYDVLRAALIGHRGSLQEQEEVTVKQWLTQMELHTCFLVQRSERLRGVPLYNASYSLGSLLTMAWQSKSKSSFFKAQLFLAPALFTHWYSNLTKALFFLNGSFGIPSKNLENYRSQSSTSLAAYRAMHKLRGLVNPIDKKILNINTLVFINPKDELVSLKNLESFKEEYQFTNWKIFKIKNPAPPIKESPKHLIIDPPTLGEYYWKMLMTRTIKYFR